MDERGDVHTALDEMEQKLHALQRELSDEAPEEGAAPSPLATAQPAPAAATPPPAAAPPQALALLRAGPFADIDSLGRFEQALRGLAGVEDVLLRGFEADRALFDVRLAARR